MIPEHPERAVAMVTSLADLLRCSLTSDRRHTVTLAEELDIVDEYVSLERVRFEDRLRFERKLEPLALSARVPPMLVHTLVENAVKHGIAQASCWWNCARGGHRARKPGHDLGDEHRFTPSQLQRARLRASQHG